MGCPHDLRDTGNQLAAAAGASTRELMHRMGNGSTRAALIHQHATGERDRAIADRLSVLVESTGASPDGVTTDGWLHANCTWNARGPVHDRAGPLWCLAGAGAGDGNRTRVASLEDWGSTIELRPHGARAPPPA